MLSTLNVNDVYEIRVRSTEASFDQEFDQVMNWCWFAAVPGGLTAQTTANALTAFRAAWRAAMLPMFTVDFKVNRYELRQITGRQAPPAPARPKLDYGDLVTFDGDPVLDVGSQATALEYLPSYCSISVEARVDKVGRQYFGVHRIGPCLEADQIDGHLLPGKLLAWQAAVAVLKNSISLPAAGPTDGSFTPVLFRKTAYLRPPIAPLVNPSAFTQPWDRVNVASRLGTQLSRKQKIRQFGT